MKLNPNQQFVYRIRRISDGLYSSGGSTPKFTKNGKCWSNIGHLKNHLTLINEHRDYYKYLGERPHPYVGCKLVCYKLVQEETDLPDSLQNFTLIPN